MKLGESREDYLEAAYILKRQKGYVRNCLLSNYLNYSKASTGIISETGKKQGTIVFRHLGRRLSFWA